MRIVSARGAISRILAEWTRAVVVSRLDGYYCLVERALDV
jgi:hypothetical protein